MPAKRETPPKLFDTEPHGEHAVYLLDDDENPQNRIFAIRGSIIGRRTQRVHLLGSEVESIARWWLKEQQRAVAQGLDRARKEKSA